MAIHINMNYNIHNRKLWKAIIFMRKKEYVIFPNEL